MAPLDEQEFARRWAPTLVEQSAQPAEEPATEVTPEDVAPAPKVTPTVVKDNEPPAPPVTTEPAMSPQLPQLPQVGQPLLPPTYYAGVAWPSTFTVNVNSGTGGSSYPASSTTTASSGFQVGNRPLAPVTEADKPVEQAKAFVTEINGKTLISAPATITPMSASLREPTLDDITAEHMLWMHGKFVGAEVPNRNGAMWSAGDLQMAQASVVNGPLNWLHEAKHVIGSIARADYIGAAETAAQTVQPHITATAGIWKWIYPDEAFVINQASDQNQLWYSMECVSKEVACAGPEGCGNTTTYAAYLAGAACDHVKQRASVRQFKNPVFLGGAVIVPPTRPGWAEADASVMKTAAKLAEAAFEQAGEPDVRSNTWEQLMAQIVRYAQA